MQGTSKKKKQMEKVDMEVVQEIVKKIISRQTKDKKFPTFINAILKNGVQLEYLKMPENKWEVVTEKFSVFPDECAIYFYDDDAPFTIPDTLKFMDGIIPSPSDEDDDTPDDPWSVCGDDDTTDRDAPTDPLAVLDFDDSRPGPGEDEPDNPLTYFDPQDGGPV